MFSTIKSMFQKTPEVAKPAPIVTTRLNLSALRTPGPAAKPAAKLPQPTVKPVVAVKEVVLPEVQPEHAQPEPVIAQPPQVLVDGEPLDWNLTDLNLRPRSPAMIQALLAAGETESQRAQRISNDAMRFRRSRGLL
jgi:hypothetical protein